MMNRARVPDLGWQIAGVVGSVAIVVALVIAIFAEPHDADTDLTVSWASDELAGTNSTESAAPSDEGRPLVSVIGDSFTAGTPQGGRDRQGWPALVWERLSAQGLPSTRSVDATGGSGYLEPGPFGVTFMDAVQRAVAPDDDLVVVFGGTNDVDLPLDELSSAAQNTLEAVRHRAPSAALIVVGPVWPGTSPSPAMVNVRDVLRAVAQSLGATFVDPIQEAWFADQPQLIGRDHVHPNDDGHKYLADHLFPVIDAALRALPNGTGQ